MNIEDDLIEVNALAHFYETLAIFYEGRDRLQINITLLALEFLEELLEMINNPPCATFEYQLFLERLIDIADDILQENHWHVRGDTAPYNGIGYVDTMTTRDFNAKVMSSLHTLEDCVFCGEYGHEDHIKRLLVCYVPYIGQCNLPRINEILRKEEQRGPAQPIGPGYDNDYHLHGCTDMVQVAIDIAGRVVNHHQRQLLDFNAGAEYPGLILPRNYNAFLELEESQGEHEESPDREKRSKKPKHVNPFEFLFDFRRQRNSVLSRFYMDNVDHVDWDTDNLTRTQSSLDRSELAKEGAHRLLARLPLARFIIPSSNLDDEVKRQSVVKDAVFVFQKYERGSSDQLAEFLKIYERFPSTDKLYLVDLASKLFDSNKERMRSNKVRFNTGIKSLLDGRVAEFRKGKTLNANTRTMGQPESSVYKKKVSSQYSDDWYLKSAEFSRTKKRDPVLPLRQGTAFHKKYTKKYKKTMKQKIKQRRSHKRPRVSKKI